MGDQNFEVMSVPGGAPVKMWTRGVPVEDEAREQLARTARMPFIFRHLAVMPDVHVGKGSTVGSVIPTRKAVIPAAVGVDIGCGMMAAKTTLTASDLPDSLRAVRTAIERAVPHGRSRGKRDRGAWGASPPAAVDAAWATLADDFARLVERSSGARDAPTTGCTSARSVAAITSWRCVSTRAGSCGSMLHSGSRGVGNAIGSHFIELAKEDMRAWMVNLPDQDLAYLPEGTAHFDDYVEAVEWAQDFARANREVMMQAVIRALRSVIDKPFDAYVEAVNCHHNYVARERHFGEDVLVTRKGAVSAREGELGIIPGSMGARSFIVRGLGNEESFQSCSHGAGRRMSRTEARKRFTLADHRAATAEVECRKDEQVIDETPAAYKDIDAVMSAQNDLVEVVHTLKQVVCVKG